MAVPRVQPPGTSIAVVKQSLCDLASAEHHLFRVERMVQQMDVLIEQEKFPEEAHIDHNVLHRCLALCMYEVDQRKNALKALLRTEESAVFCSRAEEPADIWNLLKM